MAKGRLFECALLYHPQPTKAGDTVIENKSELIGDVKRMLASSEQQAAMMMARAIPEEYVDKLDEVEVLIRPFA